MLTHSLSELVLTFALLQKTMSEIVIGSRKQIRNMFTSDEAYEKATTFKPKPSDCFVATPPKTGTTLLQFACHLLRSANDSHEEQNLDEWSKMACNFEDIHQVSPMVMMAWDIGFDLTDKNYEQKCPDSNQAFSVRVFKVEKI